MGDGSKAATAPSKEPEATCVTRDAEASAAPCDSGEVPASPPGAWPALGTGLPDGTGLLRDIVSGLHETIIFGLDRDGNYLFGWADPALEQAYGIEISSLAGRNLADVFPPEQAAARIARTRQIHDLGVRHREEYSVKFPGGEFWHDVSLAPMVDRAGRVTAVLAVAHDVTAHKRADAALRESEQRYRSVVEQTNDAVVIHRDDGVVVFANTAAGKMVSLPEGESLVGRLVIDFIAPESLAFALRRVADALSSERPLPAADETLVTLEGRRLQVEIIGQRINYDGKAAVLITIRDSSERRRLETQMHRAQKLESLGALAGGVAHDFNNLLQAMIGNANLARRGLPPTSDALGPLKNVETAAQRAAELTRQLRSYAGEGAGVATIVDLAALVREMAELLRVSVHQHAALDLDLAPDTPPAFGDPTQIRQVIMNLIVNASEALGTRGGRIRILCRPVQADQALLARAYVDDRLREGEYVCVEVQDDGCGIDEETIARLFDPFFSTKSSGRGLGLAATLGIVRKHHGAVFVESQPGNGSKFTVLFPRAADSTKCDAEPQALQPR